MLSMNVEHDIKWVILQRDQFIVFPAFEQVNCFLFRELDRRTVKILRVYEYRNSFSSKLNEALKSSSELSLQSH